MISGTRGGKGVSCVLPAIIDHQGPVVVLDVKGELFAMTRRYRQSQGRQVAVINPFHLLENNKVHWNPLDYIRPHHFDEDVAVIVDALIEPDQGKNSHFSDTASDILKTAIGVLFETTSKDKFNLVEVYKYLFSNDLKDVIKGWKDQKHLVRGKAAELAHTILGTAQEESGGFGTTLKRKLEWIRLQNYEELLTKSDFNLDSLINNKLDIYCVVPVRMLKGTAGSSRGFMRLFTNIMMGTINRQNGINNVKAPILMVLDEFTRLGYMEEIGNIITTGVGAGLELFMVAQDRASIEEVWNNNTDSLVANAATTRVFNLGRGDYKTSAWIASLMNDVTLVTHSKNSSSSNSYDRNGESLSQTKDKLLTAVEIQEMDHNTMICLLRNNKPLLLQRIISHKHSAYKKKLNKNVTLR